ncbi:hypothetical protein JBE04_02405 [Streptomyces sp. PRKS01-29]|nr:hypothetical protein [Streptomyces sabulosicollis]MBI0293370.1 hypothetical protein [Streptomyces sabulosicollis]
MARLHPWFGDLPRDHEPSWPVRRIREALVRELRDCGTRLDQDQVPLEPFVIARDSYLELFSATRKLLDLVHRAVRLEAATTSGRLAALGIDESQGEYPLFSANDGLEDHFWTAMARPDVVIGPEGPQFIEFNVSGAICGPAETYFFNKVFTEAYGGSEAAPFVGYHAFPARASLFEAICEERGLPKAVALIGSPLDHHAEGSTYFDVEVDYLRSRGFDARFFPPEELPHGLGLPARLDYPLALRYFATADWRDRGVPLDGVRDVLDAGCLLVPPQSSSLLANKKVLGWLSEGRPWMDEEDRALVQRYLPWTRIATDAKVVGPEGLPVRLPHLLKEDRESFVLKRAVGMMGRGVLIGRDTGREQWERAVDQAVATGAHIVQEFVEPAAYPLRISDEQGDGSQWAEVALVLSPCLIGGRPAGCYGRYLTSGLPGVIGEPSSGAMENVILSERLDAPLPSGTAEEAGE